ncbi:hypothetical protein [Nostoc sp. LEGE 12450]|uniref:hypothetical protein n=1 Tax=Nostoc sp. LEGE 12450 TaxID=1828643 RepID=UPI0018821A27|nr:hypothetical protein [Nostoc sp. LEGE 12450]MBE8989329.1 hypothetical protein [Nostoc sp. LEGE 12450]
MSESTLERNETVFDLDSQDTFQLTERNGEIGILSSNCNEVQDEIRSRFDVAKFGSCNHPTKADATAFALSVLVPLVIAEGGVLETQAGERPIKHRTRLGSWTTYLSYAAGNQIK